MAEEEKVSLCDNCKGPGGVVNCNPLTCTCDCHFEIDMIIEKELELEGN